MADESSSMKLLIDSNGKRVLFAEATKECVDFLFHILSLPVATIIRLLGKNGMVGSLSNLYQSIENLNESYMQPNQTKDTLLKPVCPVTGSYVPLLAIKDAPSTQKKFYRCGSSCTHNFTDDPSAICPNCRQKMTQVLKYVAPPKMQQESGTEGGFVKGVVTYMVMDDLVVTPMSTISSITLLNKLNVKDVGTLDEKVVNLGMTEAVKLLKASMETKNVLTHVFLNCKN